VVILDEFEKLDREAQLGFLEPFDSGEWVDKKLSTLFQSRKVSCRKTVFVLTTNILLRGETLDARKKELQSHFPKVGRCDLKHIETRVEKACFQHLKL